ncbi:LapA family protein [Herpetosiphon gulosus]|uniref:Lipopolysaccharide assembly protein A domain-containing protein n=1 Tax=Herpetosiphon gulosus TaxID=1973496 RepID=A0ABP9X5E0_9CHLR
MKAILGIVTGILMLLFAAIGFQNTTAISIHLFDWQTPALPLWMLLLTALASGMLVVGLFAFPRQIETYYTNLRQRGQAAPVQRPLIPIDAAMPPPTTMPLAVEAGPQHYNPQTGERLDPWIDDVPKRTV